VFAALRRLAPARLEGRDKGDLIALITTDIELLEVFYAHTVSPVAIAVLVSLIMCAYMTTIHPLFLLIAALSYLVVGLLLPSFNGWMIRERGQRFRDEFARLNSFLFDSLRGVGQSIQYGEGPRRLKTLVERSERLAGYQKRLKLAEGRSAAVTDATIFLASILMLVAGILLHQAGTVGFEAVLLSTVGHISSFGPVIALSALSNNLAQTFASANRVFDLMDEQPVVEEVTTGATVEFEDARLSEVSFAYDEAQVLHGLSLAIGKGQIVGLVGRSGSGKSTVLKLLMRFWDVSSGSVTLSGRELRTLNTDCLRSLQGYMTQDTQLFNDTLLNNLRVARPEATLEEVEQACRRASLYEFIHSLPQGLETTVGELGERLSGGERQRIGLARAFLHDAPLILLDEPTSNLDSLNEAVILKSLYESRHNRTVVLVSHRHSTMRVADAVHEVHNGRLS
jgi:ATP-binding cassette subfamily C protein